MLTTTAYSQTNLVPNPSFEIYTTCPDGGGGELNYAPPWYPPTAGSPDYFNQCNNSSSTFGANASVPANSNGYQYARTGVAYAGFSPSIPDIEYREYIQAPLLSPLIVGKMYCVEFYVSLADSIKYAITEIGAYFSNGPIINMGIASNLPYNPQVRSPVGVFLSDKNNWMKISGSFIANGGENYITIGNFKNDINTDTLSTNIWSANGETQSYYYIDDISVIYECDTVSNVINIANIFTPNGDNNNDQFVIQDKSHQIKLITIYDRWGIKVFETNNINEPWDGRTTSGIPCTEGIYYYILELHDIAQNNLKTKGFIQLMK